MELKTGRTSQAKSTTSRASDRFKPFYKDNNSIIDTIRKRKITKGDVVDFQQGVGISQEKIAGFLNIHKRTLTGNKVGGTDSKLDANAAEKFLLIARLYDKGSMLFGSPQKFTEWLNKKSSSYGFYGKIPSELLDTTIGITEVYKELIRIEFGDYS